MKLSPDSLPEFDRLVRELRRCIHEAQDLAGELPKCRDVACVLTKLDEAEMWLHRAATHLPSWPVPVG